MHRHTLAPLALTAAVVIVAATTGCATSKPAPPPIYYPATQPRVQFLLGFMDVDRWVEKRSSLAQFVMGTTEQVSHEIKSPYGMAIRNGRMYICDLGLHCVHVVDLAARTYARLGTPQQVLNPVHVTLAPDGTKYVCDTDPKHNAVVVFDAQDKYVRDIVPPEGTRIIDVALYKDELIVADIDGGHVLAWDRDGKLLRQIAGPGRARPSSAGRPTWPSARTARSSSPTPTCRWSRSSSRTAPSCASSACPATGPATLPGPRASPSTPRSASTLPTPSGASSSSSPPRARYCWTSRSSRPMPCATP